MRREIIPRRFRLTSHRRPFPLAFLHGSYHTEQTSCHCLPPNLQTLPRSPGWTSMMTTRPLRSRDRHVSAAHPRELDNLTDSLNAYAHTHAPPDAQAQAFGAYAADDLSDDWLGTMIPTSFDTLHFTSLHFTS